MASKSRGYCSKGGSLFSFQRADQLAGDCTVTVCVLVAGLLQTLCIDLAALICLKLGCASGNPP
jgi:hypothetical protein